MVIILLIFSWRLPLFLRTSGQYLKSDPKIMKSIINLPSVCFHTHISHSVCSKEKIICSHYKSIAIIFYSKQRNKFWYYPYVWKVGCFVKSNTKWSPVLFMFSAYMPSVLLVKSLVISYLNSPSLLQQISMNSWLLTLMFLNFI